MGYRTYDYGVTKPTFAQPAGANKLVIEATAMAQVFVQPCRWFDSGLVVTGPLLGTCGLHDIPPFQQCPSGGQSKFLKFEVLNPPAGKYQATAWMGEATVDQFGKPVVVGKVFQSNETTLP